MNVKLVGIEESLYGVHFFVYNKSEFIVEFYGCKDEDMSYIFKIYSKRFLKDLFLSDFFLCVLKMTFREIHKKTCDIFFSTQICSTEIWIYETKLVFWKFVIISLIKMTVYSINAKTSFFNDKALFLNVRKGERKCKINDSRMFMQQRKFPFFSLQWHPW